MDKMVFSSKSLRKGRRKFWGKPLPGEREGEVSNAREDCCCGGGLRMG